MCTGAGTIPPWWPCFGVSDCQPGSACIGLGTPQPGPGVCKPFCASNADCAPNATCNQIDDPGSGDPIPGLEVCSSGCDPANPSAICGDGVTCYPFPWDGLQHDHGDCVGPSGTGIGPDACAGDNANTPCAPGYYCTVTHDCARFCRLGPFSDCTNGQTCVGFGSPQPVIDGVEYGVCVETD
jgi:hypothetical protein